MLKRLLLLTILFFIFTIFPLNHPPAAYAQGNSTVSQELCLPGVYLNQTTDCLPLGPSEYLTRMAKSGINFPLVPLAARSIDPKLGSVPYLYAEMKDGAASVYGTLEDAVAKKNSVNQIGPGKLKYVSYTNIETVGGQLYFQLRSGEWIAASDGISQRVSLPSSFRGGLEFTQTPLNSFGWIVPLEYEVESKRSPGVKVKDYTGHKYLQYQIVQVYATQKVGDADWYLIGPDEWMEGRRIGRVNPNTTPPAGVNNGRWIEVNLFEQTVAVYADNQLIYASLIATGLPPFWTRPGLFKIYKKLESTPMSGSFELDRSDFYYLQDVPFTMYYDDARALHGAYWRHRLGFPQSHGCVNLSVADAHWLYNWASEGDWVYVWDPSGKTPTDPEAYSGGGAP